MAFQINTTPAILGHNIIKPQVSIEQPKAQVEGSISFAQVRVEATLPKVTIDQDQAFNESGLKNNKAFSEDNISFAQQKMHEGVGRITSQGNDLADIQYGGNPIADQGFYNAYDQFYHEFGMVTMPRSGAQIDVIEGTVDITVQEGQITGSIRAQKPIISYQQGRIERYMEQYSSISIKYIGEKVDMKV